MLFLTLCLLFNCFSCFPIYQKQDNVLEIQEHKQVQEAYTDNYGYTYVGLSEFGDYSFYLPFMQNIARYGTVYNTGVSYDDFRNGSPVTIYQNLTLQLGTLNNATYTFIRNITAITIQHTYINDYATQLRFTFYQASGSADYVVRGYYYFNDLTLRNCINNNREILGTTNAPFGETNIVLRWVYEDYASLFPYLTSRFDEYGAGYDAGYNDGYNYGEQVGYNEGLEAFDNSPEIASIFSGILEVALLPVNVFLSILNFEVFGINISGLVSGFLTISVVVIIIRFIFGGKKDD